MANGHPVSPYQYRGLYRTTSLPPCIVSLVDLRRLYAELDAKTMEALERHLAAIQKPADMEQATFEELKANALRDGHLTVTVIGAGGEQLVSRSGESVNADSLPEKITLMRFDSAAAM